ncbi:hypothetical protein SAMN02746062_01195 [Alysiella filiformis DSM 16848]|uniref:Uncharacterized protein n=1 Tax=Alysiella filiformis DSM 16848 TaxID=1120981 RepID=A0A286EBL4_9NEIS|nr:hypothetical protein SAMN02746062_01195 [Alysiella filiformis DSM 16848]
MQGGGLGWRLETQRTTPTLTLPRQQGRGPVAGSLKDFCRVLKGSLKTDFSVFRLPVFIQTRLQRTRHFHHVKAFQLVAFHDFIEVFNHQTAFKAHFHFFYIVFKAFER